MIEQREWEHRFFGNIIHHGGRVSGFVVVADRLETVQANQVFGVSHSKNLWLAFFLPYGVS